MTQIPFGQYKGYTVAEIVKVDRSYIKWCLKNCHILKKDKDLRLAFVDALLPKKKTKGIKDDFIIDDGF